VVACNSRHAHGSQAKLSVPTLREGVLTGRRYSSSDALDAGIIDRECPMDELAAVAEQMATAVLPTKCV
jgi:enoyl-CoA hydratase/carnithine racemase